MYQTLQLSFFNRVLDLIKPKHIYVTIPYKTKDNKNQCLQKLKFCIILLYLV